MTSPAPLRWVDREEFLLRAERAWPSSPGAPPLTLVGWRAGTHARDLDSLLPLLRWDCEATPSLEGVVRETRSVVRVAEAT